MNRRRTLVAGIIVFLVTLGVFAPLCGHDFTWWDDFATVWQNEWMNPPTWRSVGHYWTSIAYGLYVPLTYTVWIGLACVARVDVPDEFGNQLNPWIFHSANVLAHAAAAVVAFALLRRLTKRDGPSAIGALIFALHPVQVEAVGWVSGLKDVLAGCLALVALWRYVARAQVRPDRSFIPDTWGTLALTGAMLSKPSAMMVPVIAIVIDGLILRRGWRTALMANGVWLVLAAVVGLIARRAQDVTGIPEAPLWARPLIFGDALAFYARKLVFPLRLGVDYGRRPSGVMRDASFYFAWLVPGVLAVGAWLARRRRPWLAAAGATFVLAILPVSGLTTFLFQFTSTVTDHYLYLAMIGPAIAVAFLLCEYDDASQTARRVAWTTAVVALFMFAGRSVAQTFVWQDDFTLFENALEVNPNSFVAHNNLGHAYLQASHGGTDRTMLDLALEQFNAAMQLEPDYPNPYENAARVLAMLGRVDESVAAIERSIEIRSRLPRSIYPNYMEDHNRVGQVLLNRGEYARAIAHFEALLKENPNHKEALKYLAIARQKLAESATRPTTTQAAVKGKG